MFQEEIEAALEALPTVTDVSVTCDFGVLCNTASATTCAVEFLTELGDVPPISASVSNVDFVFISEYQVSVWIRRGAGGAGFEGMAYMISFYGYFDGHQANCFIFSDVTGNAVLLPPVDLTHTILF